MIMISFRNFFKNYHRVFKIQIQIHNHADPHGNISFTSRDSGTGDSVPTDNQFQGNFPRKFSQLSNSFYFLNYSLASK